MIKMCKHSKNLIAFVLVLVMVFAMAVPAFAADGTGNTETANSVSVADITPQRIQTWRAYLYRNTTSTLNKVPTDLAPTPLPEDLNLDPLDYWEQIIPDPCFEDAGEKKTTRPVEEIYQEIRQLVDELTAGLTTDSDKFAALSLWVDRNITYSTDKRTDNVYWIYERRYGACVELSYLLYFMATLAGVKAAVLAGDNHQTTAALDENGAWFGDAHSAAVGNPVASVAYYDDGQDKYVCRLETGEIRKNGTIKGKKKPIDASSINFIDVPEDAWYADAVKWAVTWSITNGTSENTFSPNKLCTNDEILTFLYRAADDYKFDGDRRQPFTPKNGWAADALKWAYYKNIVSYGYEDEDAPCTRYNAVYYIWKAFGDPYDADTRCNFTDVEGIDYCKPAIDWAVSKGIVKGTSETTFSPDAVCDRATIVTLLYRAYKDSKPLS